MTLGLDVGIGMIKGYLRKRSELRTVEKLKRQSVVKEKRRYHIEVKAKTCDAGDMRREMFCFTSEAAYGGCEISYDTAGAGMLGYVRSMSEQCRCGLLVQMCCGQFCGTVLLGHAIAEPLMAA